jgi:hypothetical protein
MTAKDAYMFPVMGSAVLFSLYLLFKFLDKDLVNMLLTLYPLLPVFDSLVLKKSAYWFLSIISDGFCRYFLIFGFFAVSQTLAIPLRRVVPALASGQRKFSFTIPFTSGTFLFDTP